MDVLLRNNRRAASALLGACVLLFALGLGLVVLGTWSGPGGWRWGLWGLGVALVLGGGCAAWAAWRWWRTPRLVLDRRDHGLLIYLGRHNPFRVPLDVVECFFYGQAPSAFHDPQGREVETRNVVVRLAERAVEWQDRTVVSALGHWCGGYITIYGTWCEPLSREQVEAMNHALLTAKRARHAVVETHDDENARRSSRR